VAPSRPRGPRARAPRRRASATTEARGEIGVALVRMLPAMADAQQDSMATGAGCQRIVFGQAMGRAIAGLVLTGSAKVAPGRFAR